MVAPTRQSGSRDPTQSAADPRPLPGPEQSQVIAAANLLAVESKVRAAKNERELTHLIADELRKLVSARQVIVLRQARSGEFAVACISSIPLLDRETPFVRWIEECLLGTKLVSPGDEKLFHVTDSVEEAIDIFLAFRRNAGTPRRAPRAFR